MRRLTVLALLMVAACDTGSPASPSRAMPTVAPAGTTGAPADSSHSTRPSTAPDPGRQSMVISSTETGADRAAFDYDSTDDVFVRLTFADASFDGRTVRLSVSPVGGGALIAYQTQVVSRAATFDFAVSGTLFGRNAQPGQFTFLVTDVTTQTAIGKRDVQFTSGGRP